MKKSSKRVSRIKSSKNKKISSAITKLSKNSALSPGRGSIEMLYLTADWRRNPSRIRSNPGGGWIFEGKFPNKWDAIRPESFTERSLHSRNGDFIVEVRDRKDGSWWKVLANKKYIVDDLSGGINKKNNVINVKQLISEVDRHLVFRGLRSSDWVDIRIGYNSGGPELLDKDGIWYSVNLRDLGNWTFDVGDIRYPIERDF